jgi:hypothetical protein
MGADGILGGKTLTTLTSLSLLSLGLTSNTTCGGRDAVAEPESTLYLPSRLCPVLQWTEFSLAWVLELSPAGYFAGARHVH